MLWNSFPQNHFPLLEATLEIIFKEINHFQLVKGFQNICERSWIVSIFRNNNDDYSKHFSKVTSPSTTQVTPNI